ncbi:MAG: 4-vinyl reductase [Candidatus Nanohaloarchaea archaeon]|nr:4-vinyl reductase [Candidatus Nanohaloarchaea archaeon]
MDGEDDLTDGLDELAESNDKLADDEVEEVREERGRKVDMQFLREVMYGLEAVSMGTHQLLYFSAMQYARDHLETEAESVEEAVEELSSRFERMNVGSIVLEQDEDNPRIKMEENAVSYDAPRTGRKMDYFIAGYIAGYLENALGDKYVVNEIECSAEGGEVCVFQIKGR